LCLSLAVAAGYAVTRAGPFGYVALGLAGITAVVAVASMSARAREIYLWLVLLVCALNFLPALFQPVSLTAQPAWQKVLRDIPIAGLLLIASLTWTSRSRKPSDDLTANFTLALLGLAVIMLIDYLVRHTHTADFLVSLRYYVGYPLVALAVARLDFSDAEIRRFAQLFVVVGALEGVLAVLNSAGVVGNNYYAQGVIPIGGHIFARAVGTLGNPNNLGLFLGFPLLLVFYRAVFSGWRRKVSFALIALGVLATFSKTAAIALGFAIVLEQVTQKEGRPNWRRVVLLVGMSVLFLLVTFVYRVHGVFTAGALLGARTAGDPETLHHIVSSLSSLAVGSGYGSITAPGAGFQTAADNMLLAIAVEGGIIGLVIFVALVLSGFRFMARARRVACSPMTRSLFSYGVFFLVYAMASSSFRLFPGAVLFWIAAGLAATLASRKPSPAQGPTVSSVTLTG
jgi:hypothetical protein